MKRLAAALFILLLASSLVSAVTYELPGEKYNNIGIMGEVMINLNVTMVNTAPFPKFVVVNPRYDFTVYRLGNSENMQAILMGDTVLHTISDVRKSTLNYYTGFWIMPYETVVVNFRITSNYSYVVPTLDYESVCGDTAKITSVKYNGSEVSGVIEDLDNIGILSCGVIYPQLVNTPKVIFEIYLVLTLLGVYLYYMNGMNLFDALTHSMTGLGTGGMSTHDESIGYFNSMGIEAVTIFLMIMGAVNFTVHYRMFSSKRLKAFFDDIQVRYMFLFLAPTVLLLADVLVKSGDGVGTALRQSVFHAVSAITCTGFGIADLGKYPELGKFLIAILMVVGGGAGSTAGGIKLIRVTLMYESLKWTLQQAILPRGAVIKRKVGEYVFTESDIQEVMSFTMTYIAILLAGTVYTSFRLGTSLVNSFFEVASAQGNVGLSVGITSPALPLDIKILLILHMWIGRLEIFSTLVFIISVLFLAPRMVKRK